MIAVAGIWELGWNTPIKEIELWEYPLRDFGVDKFVMSPVSGIRSDFVQEVHDLGVYVQEQRAEGVSVVFVDERGTTDLADFVHPENCVYVFGKASLSTLTAYGKSEDQSIKITTPNNLATLWPHQAAVLVLNDRFIKERTWQSQ